MCGVAGYHLKAGLATESRRIRDALTVMDHRGPDDEGITFIDLNGGTATDFLTERSAAGVRLCRQLRNNAAPKHDVCFGHRRFSIIDLSPAGHQPLWTVDGNVCVAVNGEVYNFVEIRRELEDMGFRFASHSDSEVLAVAYQAWGPACFAKLNGFWALCLFDAKRKQVLLARDRVGKAPLYVFEGDEGFFWASEINALRKMLSSHHFGVNLQAVVDFVEWQKRDLYGTTFFEGIRSLPSATFALLKHDGSLAEHRYWDLPSERLRTTDITTKQAACELRNRLEEATRLRLRADVPVAMQLSGGLDSSAVLALAAANSPRVSAFTVSFPGTEYDEEPYARAVVQRYFEKIDYTVVEPPDDEFLTYADEFVALMGEPFHSPNQFTANRIWRKIADRGFKVNLYGTGGDEVLAGYPRHHFFPFIRHQIRARQLSTALRELLLMTVRSGGILPKELLVGIGRTIPGAEWIYDRLFRSTPGHFEPFIIPDGLRPHPGPSASLEVRMRELMTDLLMNYWLRIDNQNSMSIPLELRSPFLDYRVVEFGFNLPLDYLIRDGWMKWLLRDAMDNELPAVVTWRKRKMGFPFPLRHWLGRHRERILAMVNPIDCPFLDSTRLETGWEFLAKRNPGRLWCLVSLALWWKRCIQGESLTA